MTLILSDFSWVQFGSSKNLRVIGLLKIHEHGNMGLFILILCSLEFS